MIPSLLKAYLKEWARGGSGRRLIQILVLVILPVMIYVFSVLTSQGLFSRVPMVLNIGAFVVFIVSSIYSFSYRTEAEDKLTDDFPMDFLPINQGYVFAIQALFISVLLYFVIASSLLMSSLILNSIIIDGNRMYPFAKSISTMHPLFVGLLYGVPMSVLFGGFLGSIAKKISDNFSGGLRRFVIMILYVVTFIVFRKYFADSFRLMNEEGFLESAYMYSIAGLSTAVMNIFFGEFNFLQFASSAFFFAGLYLGYLWINSRKWKFIRDFEVYTDIKGQKVRFLSPMYNLVLRRIFTTPVMVLVTAYVVLIAAGAVFPGTMWIFAVTGILSYIYLFMFLERIFPQKNENYRHIVDAIPVSQDSVQGMLLGVYYILFLMPFFAANIVILSNGMAMQNVIPQTRTLSQFIAVYILPLCLSAIIPSVLLANPYFLSENDKGKKASRGMVIVVLVLSYVFFSNLSLFMNMYFVNPMFQEFVGKMFWNKGYYVWKTFVYFIVILSALIHMYSIYRVILSFRKQY
ncbi:MAG: hypothetical protein PHW02_06390 [bacterium]|nr:hypothetical protein [bacterium]